MDTAFFIASKIFWAGIMPLNLAVICLGAGLVAGVWCKNTRNMLIGFAFFILVVCGVLPTGHIMLHHLETRVAAPAALPDKIDGILVLGGAINTRASTISGQPELNEGAERILSAMVLSRRYPDAKIVFSGGANVLTPDGIVSENSQIERVRADLGFDSHKIVYEGQSRNTAENIHNSFTLLKPTPDQSWILVTSAFHMPRTLGITAKTGWAVIPYPVDYRSNGGGSIIPRRFDVLDNLYATHLSLRELIGLLAYRMTGKL